jgi:hypothetical protein
LWNYNPLNSDQHGDSWNEENFSWFSSSDVTEERLEAASKLAVEHGEDETMAMLNIGARILDAIEVSNPFSFFTRFPSRPQSSTSLRLYQRPCAVKTAGIPLRAKYDFHNLSFSFAYINPIPATSPLAAVVPPATSSPSNPPIVGEACAARETEVYLPSRRYANHFRAGTVDVRLRENDGDWRWDEEVSFSRIIPANLLISAHLSAVLRDL